MFGGYSSEGDDLGHLMRVRRFHNTMAVREIRLKNGDTNPVCKCDMCKHAEAVLMEWAGE